MNEIGRGGMGIIFLAEKDNEGVKDTIVLKTIKTHSKEHEDRLKQEANVATGLRHENIVKTYGLESIQVSLLPESFRREIDSLPRARVYRHYDHFSPISRMGGKKYHRQRLLTPRRHHRVDKHEKKLFFIAMDYIQGLNANTLNYQHIEKGLLLPCPLIGFIISRICRALAYAHQFIIHRDISPENILINTQGVCKLSDFGVAAQTQAELELLAGKLGYMSPEHIGQKGIDARTDIFSLGQVAYELLTGIMLYDPPWEASFDDRKNFVLKEMKKDIIPPHHIRTDVPEILSSIVMKMLAKDKTRRYQNMYDVGDVIEQKYIYAKGFGPTNNSLASYIEIFYSDFKEYDEEQLRQLNFLTGPSGKLVLKRKVRPDSYTPEGLEFISSRPDSFLGQVLSKQMQSS